MRVLFDLKQTNTALLNVSIQKFGGPKKLIYENYIVTSAVPIDFGFCEGDLTILPDALDPE